MGANVEVFFCCEGCDKAVRFEWEILDTRDAIFESVPVELPDGWTNETEILCKRCTEWSKK